MKSDTGLIRIVFPIYLPRTLDKSDLVDEIPCLCLDFIALDNVTVACDLLVTYRPCLFVIYPRNNTVFLGQIFDTAFFTHFIIRYKLHVKFQILT